MILNGQTSRVDCLLCNHCAWYHTAGWLSLSVIQNHSYIEWSDSRRVDCLLSRCINSAWYHTAGWFSLSAFTTWYTTGWHSSSIIQTTWMMSTSQKVVTKNDEFILSSFYFKYLCSVRSFKPFFLHVADSRPMALNSNTDALGKDGAPRRSLNLDEYKKMRGLIWNVSPPSIWSELDALHFHSKTQYFVLASVWWGFSTASSMCSFSLDHSNYYT